MRRTLRHRLLPLSLLLLAGCDPIWSVSGRAYRCDDKRALEGVSVSLEVQHSPERTVREEGVTGADGSFRLQVIANHGAPATLTLSKPGYVGVTHEYRKVPPQGESMSLCLTPMTQLPPME
ncbi:MAG TPA: hypothetical protein VE153_08475 [Myxococcus sp.]|nr:hypothetical protein [Myxococcus sp.]